jgi:PBP1b-binding outer membrane lipoprotein LpoB
MKGIYILSFIAILLSLVLINSCSTPTPFYIDKKKQAIIACNGTGLKRIDIESNFEKITLEGTPDTILFNDTINAL